MYAPAGAAQPTRTLTWVDRHGVEEPIPAPPRLYAVARISPDGAHIALDIRDQESDIWMWDVRTHTLTRITFNRHFDGAPVWTPDGRRIAFRSDADAALSNLFWRAADADNRDGARAQVVVVLNWAEQLKRLVPAN